MTQSVDLANAINTFVKGCKTDGTWDAMKACCIMAAWDGLTGALYPLKGPAPTNYNFVAGDYDRETGLTGNGSNKYLNTEIAPNALPQNSTHLAAYKTNNTLTYKTFLGSLVAPFFMVDAINIGQGFRSLLNNNSGSGFDTTVDQSLVGLYAASRLSSTQVQHLTPSSTKVFNYGASAPNSHNIFAFAYNTGSSAAQFSAHRLSFYSIGESLDLALLDARVSTLMTDIGAAIP